MKQVVQGHWRALVRMFGAPVALLLLVQFAGGCLAYRTTWGAAVPRQWSTWPPLITSAASTLSTLASLAALAWFGMWMGMTSRNASLVTLKTILFVKVIPFLVYLLCDDVCHGLAGHHAANHEDDRRRRAATATTTITNAPGSRPPQLPRQLPVSAMTPLYLSLADDVPAGGA